MRTKWLDLWFNDVRAVLLYDADTSVKVTCDLAYDHFDIMHGAFSFIYKYIYIYIYIYTCIGQVIG